MAKRKGQQWVPELVTADGVHLSLGALRWRRAGAVGGDASWKKARIHYLRRLQLQLGVRGVVADTTLPKTKPPQECVEAELVSSWCGRDGSTDDSAIAMSRLTVVFFQKDGADPLATLTKLVGAMTWSEVAHVVAA